MPWIIIPLLLLAASPMSATASETISIGNFSKGSLYNWEEKSFDGKTDYALTLDTETGKKVLLASSQDGASGLFFKQRIDLNKTPWMHWSWKTESQFKNIDESTKDGDDFTARIYVVIDGGLFFWKTLALNYVWSSSHQKGEQWPNPFTSNATMFAVDSGSEHVGNWQHHKRNVRDDLLKLVGKGTQYIDAVAIMTDTDNSGLQATTYFGDIFFTSE